MRSLSYWVSLFSRELIFRLQTFSDGLLAPQSLLDRSILIIFGTLLSRCLDGILDVVTEFQEIFLSLAYYHPKTASDIINIFGSLFSISAPLANRCALSLRKSSFAKDLLNRQTALCALTSILRYQLDNSNELQPIAFSSSQIDQQQLAPDTFFPRSSVGISIDEVLTLFRRSLQQQPTVRSSLYHNLLSLFHDFPHFRQTILRFLRQHLMRHCIEDDSFLRASQNLMDGIADPLFLNSDHCLDSLGNNLEVSVNFPMLLNFLEFL